MEADLNTYNILFSSCLNKLENFVTHVQIRENLILALEKTLGKVKEGTLSPAMFPVFLARDLKLENQEIAYDLAVICAFFHTAADLTDDIEDEAENNLLINKVGKSQAINLANNLLFISQQLIADLQINDQNKLALLKMFLNCGNIMCNGQFNDIALTNNSNNENTTIKEISLINEQKAGAEFACFVAALPVALGIEPDNYYKLGACFGPLAQVFSDYIDIWGKRFSDDLMVLKNSLPVFAACNDPVYRDEARIFLAGKNDLIDKQFMLKRVLVKTIAVEEFENYLNLCKSKINELLKDLPELTITKKEIQKLISDSEIMVGTLFELRKSEAKEPVKQILTFDRSVNMTLDYLKTDNYFEDTWEVQRWGFLDEPKLTGNIFPPALIIETLLDAEADVEALLIFLLSLKQKKGWHYFSNSFKIPTDTDDLGQLLNLVGRTGAFKNFNLFKVPLKLLELNLEDSGKCPTWLADQDRFQKEEVEKTWFGNDCVGVMANLYYGLSLYSREGYKEKILKGIHYIISNFDYSNNCWNGSYYTNYYTFYLVSRLINAFNLEIECLELAKTKLLKEQKLNGSWNNSPQDTASVLLGLLSFPDIDPLILKTAMIFIQDTQKYDGSWEGEDLFICPGKDGRFTYYKNSKVTASLCLRALLRGRKKLNESEKKKVKTLSRMSACTIN